MCSHLNVFLIFKHSVSCNTFFFKDNKSAKEDPVLTFTCLIDRLAHGCISPRRIYWEIKRYEQQRTANESTYWVLFELLWRDYFRFVALKYGNRIFKVRGTISKSYFFVYVLCCRTCTIHYIHFLAIATNPQ